MLRPRRFEVAAFLLLIAAAASDARAQAASAALESRTWAIGDARRTALVHLPEKAEGSPVIFAWHGHGGRANMFAAACGFEKLWPEAVVVYPQGLPTVGRVSDPQGLEPGWQFDLAQNGDRDLKFFDAMRATFVEEFGADPGRVFSTGHSNGGRFSYVLWAARPDAVAAFAPCASPPLERGGPLAPRPCLHIAGEGDPIAPYAAQRAGMDRARAGNGCEPTGRPWGPDGAATWFPSRLGAPFVEYVHPGEHQFPTIAPRLIVAFFREVAPG